MSKDSNEETLKLKNKIFDLFSADNIFGGAVSKLEMSFFELYNTTNLKKIFCDEELIATIELFFKNNLNISTTSKVGYMHRNTLIYRIEKIRQIIGLDVKSFTDATIFQTLLYIFKNSHLNK